MPVSHKLVIPCERFFGALVMSVTCALDLPDIMVLFELTYIWEGSCRLESEDDIVHSYIDCIC